MPSYFLVETRRGPSWVEGSPRRSQPGWDAHAAFMDTLVSEGVVVLGGPIGELDGSDAVLVVNLDSEHEVRSRLASDPWIGGILSIGSIRPWTIWLRHENL